MSWSSSHGSLDDRWGVSSQSAYVAHCLYRDAAIWTVTGITAWSLRCSTFRQCGHLAFINAGAPDCIDNLSWQSASLDSVDSEKAPQLLSTLTGGVTTLSKSWRVWWMPTPMQVCTHPFLAVEGHRVLPYPPWHGLQAQH